ncbi:MAG: nitrophenyl compound nitroreductase subunit ArsF family protein [Candidatus Eisenbacteria bacterium]|nr:nitrophenyl compound nitroreductase subunit ArsF family protein [Candidatus Eisenbacteria bacterium]
MARNIFLTLSFLAVSMLSFAADKPSNTKVRAYRLPTKVFAYYFYTNVRCPTCHKLEQYSKAVIDSSFKDELASGKLEFKAINVEEKGNEHFTKDYKLYTKSLVISLVKSGKEVKSKNLTKIWEYVGNKEKFYKYVKDEIAGFLKVS